MRGSGDVRIDAHRRARVRVEQFLLEGDDRVRAADLNLLEHGDLADVRARRVGALAADTDALPFTQAHEHAIEDELSVAVDDIGQRERLDGPKTLKKRGRNFFEEPSEKSSKETFGRKTGPSLSGRSVSRETLPAMDGPTTPVSCALSTQ